MAAGSGDGGGATGAGGEEDAIAGARLPRGFVAAGITGIGAGACVSAAVTTTDGSGAVVTTGGGGGAETATIAAGARFGTSFKMATMPIAASSTTAIITASGPEERRGGTATSVEVTEPATARSEDERGVSGMLDGIG